MASENGHVAKIAAADRPITECYAEIDGVRCPVPYGLANVDGIEVVIPFGEQVSGTPLAEYAEGDIVYLNENGSPVEFYVAKHDYESALNGAGRTLLVRKDCYDQRRWHSSQLNVYPDSEIDVWLNNTWLKVLDGFVQREAAETTLYYIAGNGSDTKSTMKRAAFLLSATEVGLSSISHIVEAGTTLPTASTIKIANYDGAAAAYWTRTPRKSNTKNPISVGANGNMGYLQLATYAGFYSRPCITLPAETSVDDTGLITG